MQPSGSGENNKRQTSSIASRRERLSGVPVSAGVKNKAASPHTKMQVYDRPEFDTQQFIRIRAAIKRETWQQRWEAVFKFAPYILASILLLSVLLAVFIYLYW